MKNYLSTGRLNGWFDDVFDSFFKPVAYDRFVATGMKTDIKEHDDRYEFVIEVPGYEKENVNIDLQNGYLTVSATKEEKDENNKDGKFIRRERACSCSRSYYVGDVDKESVKAKYEKGVLVVDVPKENKKIASSTRIEIE